MILIALVLAAFNLRPAVTSVGPLLEEIRTGLGMGGVVAGLLTALPAACFVAFGSLAPRLVARSFPSRLIWISLAAVTVGLALRPFMPGTATFVLVSCLALGGIGVANIMMPVVVRRAFPQRVGMVTGVYSMGLTLGAATAAAVTVPLTAALGGDWRYGLAFWAVPAALAMVVWMGVARWIRQRAGGRPAGASSGGLRLTRSRTAWAVAILFGLQSTQAYVTMGWVPQIYRDAGLSATYAGVLLALIPAVGVPTSFLVPTLAARLQNSGRCRGRADRARLHRLPGAVDHADHGALAVGDRARHLPGRLPAGPDPDRAAYPVRGRHGGSVVVRAERRLPDLHPGSDRGRCPVRRDRQLAPAPRAAARAARSRRRSPACSPGGAATWRTISASEARGRRSRGGLAVPSTAAETTGTRHSTVAVEGAGSGGSLA